MTCWLKPLPRRVYQDSRSHFVLSVITLVPISELVQDRISTRKTRSTRTLAAKAKNKYCSNNRHLFLTSSDRMEVKHVNRNFSHNPSWGLQYYEEGGSAKYRSIRPLFNYPENANRHERWAVSRPTSDDHGANRWKQCRGENVFQSCCCNACPMICTPCINCKVTR